jgi:dihydroneopterin aldolase
MAKNIQLIHHHEYLQRLFSCGPEVTSISVKNLQAIVAVGQNPWGSAHSQDPFLQPVLFSAKVSLVVPFASAAATDQLNQSTVNYSTLSKEILKCARGPGCPSAVLGLLDHIFEHLLKWNDVRGETVVPSLDETAPLLRVQDVRELELKIELPKGTLLSESIRITYSTFFTHGQLDAMEQAEVDGLSELNTAMGDQHQQKQILFPFGYRALVLTLDGLRVPTIIGINKNERTAKQNVIASISIEPLGDMGPDGYNVLEQVVYKVSWI